MQVEAEADTVLSDAGAAQKRSQILAGAARAFAAEGYEGASMSHVAREAGVSKGTLYNHFKDKADLFGAWVAESCAREIAHIFEGAEQDRDPVEALREMGHRMVGMMLSPAAITIERVVVSEAHAFPHLARAFYEAGPRPGIARMARFLTRATERGDMDVSDPAFAADQFFHLCQAGLVMLRKLRVIDAPSPEMIARTVESAVVMFLNTYGGPKPARRDVPARGGERA